jgi:hypothetical protein
MDPFKRGYVGGRLSDMSPKEMMESGQWQSFSANQKDILIRLLKADIRIQEERIRTLNWELANNYATKRQESEEGKGTYGARRLVRNPCYELGSRELVSWEEWRGVYWACEIPPTLPKNLRKDEACYLEV